MRRGRKHLSYLKGCHVCSASLNAHLILGLFAHFVETVERQCSLCDGEKGDEVGSVRGDDDDTEEPPAAEHEPHCQTARSVLTA